MGAELSLRVETSLPGAFGVDAKFPMLPRPWQCAGDRAAKQGIGRASTFAWAGKTLLAFTMSLLWPVEIPPDEVGC